VLVDGGRLAGPMMDYEVGVSLRPVKVPKLDSEYLKSKDRINGRQRTLTLWGNRRDNTEAQAQADVVLANATKITGTWTWNNNNGKPQGRVIEYSYV
jgi:hypothetical protein